MWEFACLAVLKEQRPSHGEWELSHSFLLVSYLQQQSFLLYLGQETIWNLEIRAGLNIISTRTVERYFFNFFFLPTPPLPPLFLFSSLAALRSLVDSLKALWIKASARTGRFDVSYLSFPGQVVKYLRETSKYFITWCVSEPFSPSLEIFLPPRQKWDFSSLL